MIPKILYDGIFEKGVTLNTGLICLFHLSVQITLQTCFSVLLRRTPPYKYNICMGRYLSANPFDQLQTQLGVTFYSKTSPLAVKRLHRVFSRSDILLVELLNNVIFNQWNVSSTEDPTKTCQLDAGCVVLYLVRSRCISQEKQVGFELAIKPVIV